MENIKLFLSVVSLAGLALLNGCDHNNVPQLPPITTEGKDTFGCLIDGKLFLPNAPAGQGTGVHAEIQSVTDTIGIVIYSGNNVSDQSFTISFSDTPSLKVGKEYDLTTKNSFFDYTEYGNSPWCHYDSIITGNIKLLKFDITGQPKVIAGTFEIKAISKDCKKTVAITQGRFDIGDVIQ
jgi:hypothetical protein